MKPLIPLTLMCCAAFGQAPANTPEVTPTPVPSDSHRSDYWRARAEAAEALANCKPCQEAQDKLQKALNAMATECKSPQLIYDAKGEPACPAPRTGDSN